ncbi:hypothetical protein C7M84_015978 [Penaeus vannamei]|uniref:Ig-like domain-containing protein n=1 Tax=Penaeus vannamei TaxID=6689 RepID=A0A3R7NT56_PENVA|nr:hypothetical protein C7M84_015978 [Penaeus vannamei]
MGGLTGAAAPAHVTTRLFSSDGSPTRVRPGLTEFRDPFPERPWSPGAAACDGHRGALREGERLELTCRSEGGRPRPELTWWRKGERLPLLAFASSLDPESGTYSVEASLSVRATRDAAAHALTCLPRTATVFLNTIRSYLSLLPLFSSSSSPSFLQFSFFPSLLLTLFLSLLLLTLISPLPPLSPSFFFTLLPPPFSLPTLISPLPSSSPSSPPPSPVPPLEVKILEPQEHPVRAGRALRLLCRSVGSNPPAQLAWWEGPNHLRHGSQTYSPFSSLSISCLPSLLSSSLSFSLFLFPFLPPSLLPSHSFPLLSSSPPPSSPSPPSVLHRPSFPFPPFSLLIPSLSSLPPLLSSFPLHLLLPSSTRPSFLSLPSPVSIHSFNVFSPPPSPPPPSISSFPSTPAPPSLLTSPSLYSLHLLSPSLSISSFRPPPAPPAAPPASKVPSSWACGRPSLTAPHGTRDLEWALYPHE